MLISAFAVLGLGSVSASAGAKDTQPACHADTLPAGHSLPAQPADDATPAMGCCIACVAVPGLPPVARSQVVSVAPSPQSPVLILPTGRSPAPEPGPPRAVVS